MQSVKWLLLLSVSLFFLSACSSAPIIGEGDAGIAASQQVGENAALDNSATLSSVSPSVVENEEEIGRPPGWAEASHSNAVDPNYDIVFPQDKVNQMTITMDPANWEAMQTNMTALFGERGSTQPLRKGGPDVEAGGGPPDFARPEPVPGFRSPGDGPRGDFTNENPIWVEATIEFEGNVWTNVGIRYKGNSSLMSSWRTSSLKLPLKLDFDEFEDTYPQINNQRFYGFKQLSLANGFGDGAYMRDATTYDLLAEAGLVAAETAYYNLILDYGEGPVNLGLYTVIEVVDDTVVERYFGNDDGNIYEGDGQGVTLAEGAFDQISDSFQKENNQEEADWSDIEMLYEVLHSEERLTHPEAWRAELESIFAVDDFIEWLALSAVLQHWDTYGGLTHNFYLYHNPDTNQLTWISWDHNLVLGGSGRPGGPGDQPPRAGGFGGRRGAPDGRRGGPGGRSVSLDKADVGDNWPLIRYLLDDPTYYQLYIDHLKAINNNLFDPDELAQKYQEVAALIGPYAVEEVGEETFEAAVLSLTQQTYQQAEAVSDFLAAQ